MKARYFILIATLSNAFGTLSFAQSDSVAAGPVPVLTTTNVDEQGESILADSFGRTLYYFDSADSQLDQCGGGIDREDGVISFDIWQPYRLTNVEEREVSPTNGYPGQYLGFAHKNCAQNDVRLTFNGRILYAYAFNRKQGQDLGDKVQPAAWSKASAHHVIIDK
jgi:predicted lipoprotein with Yx(FWY)xxD motif